MIKWDKVKTYLCLYLGAFPDDDIPLEDILFCLLDVLYNVEGFGWRKIAEEVTDGYVSETTLREKAISLGLKIRSRGGANYKGKDLDLREEEYNSQSNTELAGRLKVSRATIIRFAQMKGWSLKKAGRSKGGK